MPAPLPVPMRLNLPNDRWRAVDPEAYGVSNAALLAVRLDHNGDYTPTITVSGGLLSGGQTLETAADEAIKSFEAQASEVELVKREARGDAASPGMLQLLGGLVTVDGRRFDVRQAQSFLGMRNLQDADELAVIKVALSATYADIDDYLPELQELIASLEPVPQQ